MGRFMWVVVWEREHRRGSDTTATPWLIRAAVIGLAVLGVAAVITWRVWAG